MILLFLQLVWYLVLAFTFPICEPNKTIIPDRSDLFWCFTHEFNKERHLSILSFSKCSGNNPKNLKSTFCRCCRYSLFPKKNGSPSKNHKNNHLIFLRLVPQPTSVFDSPPSNPWSDRWRSYRSRWPSCWPCGDRRRASPEKNWPIDPGGGFFGCCIDEVEKRVLYDILRYLLSNMKKIVK